MYRVRHWCIRHARLLERFYNGFEKIFVALDPVWRKVGYERLDKPVAATEKLLKGAMFDCQMCGQCALSSTGMSCPMNCPKSLRNGPCGGVRSNGNCEVKPDMKCVWVAAWEGSQSMDNNQAINVVQFPVDHRLKGKSSWLRVARQKAESKANRAGTAP